MTDHKQLDQKAINTIRFLAVEAVQKANLVASAAFYGNNDQEISDKKNRS